MSLNSVFVGWSLALGGNFVSDLERQFICSFSLKTVSYTSSDVNAFLRVTAESMKLRQDIIGMGTWGAIYRERKGHKGFDQGNGQGDSLYGEWRRVNA